MCVCSFVFVYGMRVWCIDLRFAWSVCVLCVCVFVVYLCVYECVVYVFLF